MAESASASTQPCHVRSLSLSSRSHPLALKVEQELCSLRSSLESEPSAPQKICEGLRQLGSLYESIKELISLTSCQQNLTDALQKKRIEDELDESIRLLDLCSTLKHSLSTMKDHIQSIKLILRRRNSMIIGSKLNDYVRIGMKTDKKIKNLLRSKKHMEDKCTDSSEVPATIKMMREVKVITISLLQLVSSFFTRQTTRPNSSKWASLSKALSKRRVASEESEDFFLLSSFGCISSSKEVEGERVLKTKNQLQMIEVSIEGLASELDCLFRQLIQLRVSLLNLLNP